MIQSFQPNDINEKVYMCTSIVNNLSKHVSIVTDITYRKKNRKVYEYTIRGTQM